MAHISYVVASSTQSVESTLGAGTPHLYLALPHAHLVGGLRGRRRARLHLAVGQRERRAVPGAANAAALYFALGQRAAQVRAALAERVHLLALPDEDDGLLAHLDSRRLVLGKGGGIQHRRELVDGRPPGLPVDPHAEAVGEIA